ncbi:MAG: hypothetical protein HY861_02535 [Chlamydiia bacterium]|nr:hypothetical protein [Chlamydiia bacterium]
MQPISTSFHLQAQIPASTEDKPFNYIIDLQKLVAQIFLQLQRVSVNDSQSIEKMKRSYFNATLKSADLQKDYGRKNLWIGTGSFALSFAMFGFPNAEDRGFLKMAADQTPHFFGLATAGIQSRKDIETATATLEIEMYRSKTNEKSSEGSTKQDFLALLQALAESLKSASRNS